MAREGEPGWGWWAGRLDPQKPAQVWAATQRGDGACSGEFSPSIPHLMCGFSLATKSRDSSSLGGVE